MFGNRLGPYMLLEWEYGQEGVWVGQLVGIILRVLVLSGDLALRHTCIYKKRQHTPMIRILVEITNEYYENQTINTFRYSAALYLT